MSPRPFPPRLLRRSRLPFLFALAALFAAALLLGIAVRPAGADSTGTPPPDDLGSTTLTVTTSPLHDLSHEEVIAGGGGELRTVTRHDARGKLTGHTSHSEAGGFYSEARMTGAVRSTPTAVSVSSRTVSATFLGSEEHSTALHVFRGAIASDGTYSGTVDQRICDRYFGCKRFRFPHTSQLGSGAWELKLTLDGEGRSVFGAVTITTSPASPSRRRSFDYLAEGRYNARSGVATLRLVSAGGEGAPPLRLQALMTPSTNGDPWSLDAVISLSGKLLGQRILVE